MSLQPGRLIGPYQVVAPLGAGGMGEVWKVRDTRLGRDVALKVLPDLTANDPKALARFQSEAKAVATLSHPNILALHDVGEAEGVHFAVTELLEGEPLRALVADGPVPVKRALEIAGQIADALAAAHEKGIVHRDVKPENVFLTRDGRVKLLDFGLARHESAFRDPGDTHSPTVSAHTEAGSVLGTVAYMSPEQASGKAVDHRSDQFSLGTVLYEMLAGKRPFTGATAAETLTAIIREEPEPLEGTTPAVPAPVRWLVERCLAKEPSGRFESTRDLAHDLDSLRTHLTNSTAATGSVAAARPRRGLLVFSFVVLSVAAAAISSALLLRERQQARPMPGRFEIRLPEGQFLPGGYRPLALSPDGKLLAFVTFSEGSPSQLYLRPLDTLEARPIPGTERSAQPLFSPDGHHLAFRAYEEGKLFLRRVPVAGGSIRTICECDTRFGAAWTADGEILFASMTGPLQAVPAAGGTPRPVTTLDEAAGEVSHRLPHLLPDGRTILYTALRWVTEGMTWEKVRIYAMRPGTSERALLVEGGSDGHWAPPGHLLFAREGKLLAAPLDSRALQLTAPPVPVLDGVRHAVHTGDSPRETGIAAVSLGPGGLLAWVPGSVDPPFAYRTAWYSVSGKALPFQGEPIVGALCRFVSADGRRLLFTYNYPGIQAEVVDVVRGARTRATFDANPSWAIWGPGPDRITFTSDHEGPVGLYTRRPDAGPDEVELLWKPPGGSSLALGSWSPDGKLLAFVWSSKGSDTDIWVLETGKEPRPFLSTRFAEMHPDLSPDGRWLLYTSDSTGQREVFAKAVSGEGPTLHVSVGPGFEPAWSRDGKHVFYWQWVKGKPITQALYRVKVTSAPGTLELGSPERLFETYRGIATPGRSWDIGPDGKFLNMAPPDEAEERARLEKLRPTRIVVDTGGVARLIAGAKPGS